MHKMNTAPKDGRNILVYDGYCWQLAFYDSGAWCGSHHSSTHGNELYEGDLVAWMEQPEKPEWA